MGQLFLFEVEDGDDDIYEEVEHEDGLNQNHNHKVDYARW